MDRTPAAPPHEAQPSPSPPIEHPVDTTIQQPATSPEPVQAPTTTDSNPTDTIVQNLLQDRREAQEQLQAERKRKEALGKEHRARERRLREKAQTDATGGSPGPAKTPELSYAQQQRKRQEQARQERERIMREIEANKVERREREESRRALAKAEAEANSSDGANGLVDRQLLSENSQRPSSTRSSKDCAVQVRLLDGSTIRSRFPSDQTLRTHVRAWVDEQRSDGDTPYTFRQILAPQPNRAITISEEEESLLSLGLTPSATLVMVPVSRSIAAYGDAEAGLLSKGLSAGYGLVSGGVGLVTGALGGFLGIGQAAPVPATGSSSALGGERQGPHDGSSTTAGRSAGGGINVRTLRDQRAAGDEHQFYNGNQVSFPSYWISTSTYGD